MASVVSPGGWFTLASTAGDIFLDASPNDLVIHTSTNAQNILLGHGPDTPSLIKIVPSQLQLSGNFDISGDITNTTTNTLRILDVYFNSSNIEASDLYLDNQLLCPTVSNVLSIYAQSNYLESISNSYIESTVASIGEGSITNFTSTFADISNAYVSNMSNDVFVNSLLTSSNVTVTVGLSATAMYGENVFTSNMSMNVAHSLESYHSNMWVDQVATITTVVGQDIQTSNVFVNNLEGQNIAASNVSVLQFGASNAILDITEIKTAIITDLIGSNVTLCNLVVNSFTALNSTMSGMEVTSLNLEAMNASNAFAEVFTVLNASLCNALASNLTVSENMRAANIYGEDVSLSNLNVSITAQIEDAQFNTAAISNLNVLHSSNNNLQCDNGNSTYHFFTTAEAATLNATTVALINTSASNINASNIYADYSEQDITTMRLATVTESITISSNIVTDLYAANLHAETVSLSNLSSKDTSLDVARVESLNASNAHFINTSNDEMHSIYSIIDDADIQLLKVNDIMASNAFITTLSNNYMAVSNAAIDNLLVQSQNTFNASVDQLFTYDSFTSNAAIKSLITSNASLCNLTSTDAFITSTYAQDFYGSNMQIKEFASSNVVLQTASNVNFATSNLYAKEGIIDSLTVTTINTEFNDLNLLSNESASLSNVLLRGDFKSSNDGVVISTQSRSVAAENLSALNSAASNLNAIVVNMSNVAISNLAADMTYARRNIAVNTTNASPNAKLDVYGDAALFNSNAPTSTWQHMWMNHEGSRARMAVGGVNALSGGLDILVGSGTSGTIGGQQYSSNMSLMPNGFVGINTNLPTRTFHVSGNALVNGTMSSSKVSAPMNANLVLHYIFDEASADRVYDHSKTGNDATASNYQRISSAFGSTVFLHSASSFVRFTDPVAPTTTSSTCLWWFYNLANTEAYSVIVSSSAGFSFAHLVVRNDNVNNTGEIGFTSTINSVVSFTPFPNYIIRKNQWYHITVVVFGSVAELYVDGVLVSTLSEYLDTSIHRIQYLGNDGTLSYTAIGNYADFRVYDRRLYRNEIVAIRNIAQQSITLPSEALDRKVVLSDIGSNNSHQFYGFGMNSNELRYRVPEQGGHVFYGALNSNQSEEIARMDVKSGYGRLVMHEVLSNAHQFVGMGGQSNQMRYHIPYDNDSNAHVFFAGSNSTTSKELARITGSGKMGINNSNPEYTLDVGGDINFSGNFFKNGSLFQGAGSGGTTYFTTFVGINTTAPEYNLDVRGTINSTSGQFSNLTVYENLNILEAQGGTLTVNYLNVQSNINMIGDGIFVDNILVIDSNAKVVYSQIPVLSNDKLAESNIHSSRLTGDMRLVGTTTTDSVVPITDNAYYIGSETKGFKAMYLATGGVRGDVINNAIAITNRDQISPIMSRLAAGDILLKYNDSNYGTLISLDSNTGHVGFYNVTTNAVGDVQTIESQLELDNLFSLSSNYGIGVETPQESLEVLGRIALSNDKTRVTIGVTSNNIFTINGNLNFNGELYQDEWKKWVSSQWTTDSNLIGESNVYFSDGYVAIGRSNPQASLHVDGNSLIDGTLSIQRGMRLRKNPTNTTFVYTPETLGPVTNNLSISIDNSNSANGIKFYGSVKELARFTGDGKLGIGITAPERELDVDGDARIRSNLYMDGDIYINNEKLVTSYWTLNQITQDLYFNMGDVAIGTNTIPQSKLHVDGDIRTNSNIILASSAGDQNIILSSAPNALGIGKTDPEYMVDVNGTMNCLGLFVNSCNIVLASGEINSNVVGSNQIRAGSIITSKLATQSVTLANMATNSVGSGQLVDSSVITSKYADNSITSSKYASESVTSTAIATSAVVTAKIADGAVTSAKIAANTIMSTNIANGGIATENYAAGSIDTVALSNAVITTAKIATGAVTASEIAAATITSYNIATGGISTANLADNSVTSAKLSNLAVQTVNIADVAVTSSKISDFNITSTKYALGSIITTALSNAAVTSAKIAPGGVETINIASGAVTSNNIAAGTIITTNLQDSAITGAKIATNTIISANYGIGSITTAAYSNGSITADKLAPGAVTISSIADGSITGTKIAINTITGTNILANSIDTNSLSNQAVTAAKIMDSNISASKLAADSVRTIHIADGNVTGAKIASATITSTQLQDNAVLSAKIANNAVTSIKIADGAITSAKMAVGAITGDKFANNTIVEEKYADRSISEIKIKQGAITTELLAAGAVTTTRIADGAITAAKLAGDMSFTGQSTFDNLMIKTITVGAAIGWSNFIDTSYAVAQSSAFETYLNTGQNLPMHFRVQNVEAMTLNSNMYLGIGVTVPTSQLHIKSLAASSNTSAHIDASSTSGRGILQLSAGNGSTNFSTSVDFFNTVASSTTPRWRLINDQAETGVNDLRVVNASGANVCAFGQDGNISITGTLAQSSDSNLKSNFQQIANPLSKIANLTGYTFSRNDSPESERYVGMIAQDVKQVLPEAVRTSQDGFLQLDYSGLGGLYVEAIKALKEKVDALTAEVTSLRAMIA